MNPSPLFSIITPSYNHADFLPYTISSVTCQDYSNIEYLIIDGGSTDGSVELISHHANRHPEIIRWVSERDKGQADAINKGFRMAKGDIIAWINSDDCYLYKNVFTKVNNVFNIHPNVDIIYGDIVIIDDRNRVLRIQHIPAFSASRLVRKCYIAQPAVFFRRCVLELGLLNTSYSVAMDYEFWLRMSRESNFLHVPQLWAADRNQPRRKIIVMLEQLEKENRIIREKYHDQYPGIVALDELFRRSFGLFSRARGLLTLAYLHWTQSQLALSLEFDSTINIMRRQLFGRNREIL